MKVEKETARPDGRLGDLMGTAEPAAYRTSTEVGPC